MTQQSPKDSMKKIGTKTVMSFTTTEFERFFEIFEITNR